MRTTKLIGIILLSFVLLLAVVPMAGARGVVRGGAAVKALGRQLPSVARQYGMSANELAKRLRTDRDLALDARGRLFYSCSIEAPQGAAGTDVAAAADPAVPLEQTFTLHSRPGADRVIFLDFDGTVLTGTAWNAYDPDGTGPRTPSATIVAPAFDTNGDPATFSDAERIAIQQIWQRVAEDYAPFAVDITTEQPSADALTRSASTDTTYGMTVLISPISSYIGNYGGIAYVGVYNRTDATNYYKPALVFPEKLAQSEKYIAEAASHEAGHTLGLSHDGTTSGTAYYAGQGDLETGWAPIMGVGYYKNVSQWSKGEYANANQLQDDLAVMQTYGMVARPDDVGDTLAGAAQLPEGQQLAATGVITTRTDVDLYRFSAGAGIARFAVSPAARGANLDIEVALLDEQGNVLATNNPLGLLAAGLDPVVLPAQGTYYLRLDGVGEGDPAVTGYSDYASLGQYSISGSVPAPASKQAPVAGLALTAADLVVTCDGGASTDPDGSIVSYAWDFGDGQTLTAAEASATHTYDAAGSYTVTLTVTDNDGLSGTTTGTVTVLAANQLPTATITASATSGTAPLPVTFDGSASSDADGSLVDYAWSFGDGASASGAAVSHTYPAAGTYTASLTVTDDRGGSSTREITITVLPANEAPTAVIAASAIAGPAPLAVTFNAAASSDANGDTLSYAWAFGDGTSASGISASHSYAAAGTYTVTLTVTDEHGAAGRSTTQVTVAAPALKVQTITLALQAVRGGQQAQAVIKITDTSGTPVAAASVTVSWSGLVTGSAKATTNSSGTATITSKTFSKRGTVTVTISGLSKSGYTYNAAANVMSKASITY